MKYETDILKRLINTYGVMGNPCYVSEIIKEFIVRGKGCYPELFTYQSDWLAHIDEFGLNPSYTVSYTGQSIYTPNTLERPVKSAILKGQTLVNLANIIGYKTDFPKWRQIWLENTLTPNTKYFIKMYGKPTNAQVVLTHTSDLNNDGSNLTQYTTSDSYIFTTPTTMDTYLKLHINDGGVSEIITVEQLEKVGVLIVKYQDEMEKQDIPYFEGMQSVKMPVLTTTGKNLYSSEVEIGGINNSTGELSINTNTVRSKNPISVKENTTYTISNDKEYNNYIYFYSADGIFISYLAGKTNPFTFTTPSDASYIRTRTTGTENQNDLTTKWQLEKSSSASSYEPYKSNILTVNEDVTLRGIDDVEDTLDCLTGEVTERIGEIVLDGSEGDWKKNSSSDTTCLYGISMSYLNRKIGVENVFCDRFVTKNTYNQNTDEESIFASSSNQTIYIRINKNKLSSEDLTGFKQYLSQNPLTIYYQLATESIKTVDLTILDQNGQNVKQLMSFNGGTHFNTGSLEGSPLPSVSVSVETDLEETLKVCSLEGNTV